MVHTQLIPVCLLFIYWSFFVCQTETFFPCFANSHCETDVYITTPCFAALSPDTWHQQHVWLRELCRPAHRHWRYTEVRRAKPKRLMTFETKLNACVSLTETHFLLMLKKIVHVQCVKYVCQVHIKNRRTTKPVTRLKLTSVGNTWYNFGV